MKTEEELIWESYSNNKNPLNNPNFKKWFGDSVIVDENGNPKIVYHGTQSKFDEFKTDTGFIYVTDNPKYASNLSYMRKPNGGENVIPLYVRIENPLDLRPLGLKVSEDKFREFLGYKKKNSSRSKVIQKVHLLVRTYSDVLTNNVWDGIIMTESAKSYFGDSNGFISDVYVVFDKNQIKSIYNKGNWSFSDDRILECINNI
jgi:hypothetical protein